MLLEGSVFKYLISKLLVLSLSSGCWQIIGETRAYPNSFEACPSKRFRLKHNLI
ncbi:hypothetical protein M3J09_012520 [Ascochyta lentis]